MHWQNATSTLLDTLIHKPRLGLVTDMDGTISPIVDEPNAAQITPRSRELLQALRARLTLVAVISGRAVEDVRARVGLPGLVYVGNHGLESWADGRVELAPEAVAFRPALEAAMRAVEPQQAPGMRIEDKGATVSIHFRQTSDPQAVETTFTPLIQRIAHDNGLRFFQGRMVYELRPPIDVNKGSAFHHLITHYHLNSAIYLGDDTTDADALRTARRLRSTGACFAIGLGVESEDMPPVVRDNADLVASGVQDVESFLAWLLMARSASST